MNETYTIRFRRDRRGTGIAADLTPAGAMHVILDGAQIDVCAVYVQANLPEGIYAGDCVPGLAATVAIDVSGEHPQPAGAYDVRAHWSGSELATSGPAEMLAMTDVLRAAVLLTDMCNAEALITYLTGTKPLVLTDDDRELHAMYAAQGRATALADQLDKDVFERDGIA